MTTGKSFQVWRRHSPAVVGVITTPAEFNFSSAPDLFELRLDHFAGSEKELERKMSILPAPLIITARHPAEGGANNLSMAQRRELLLRFLPRAQYVDLELRSLRALRPVLDLARKKKIRRIISFHDFKSTPSVRVLLAKARAAKRAGADIFKVATRTDTPAQLQRLLDFVANQDVDLPVSVMGIGKLGRKSRRELMRRGSILNYASLGCSKIPGQPTLSEIQHWALDVER
jgi:3-dehydroquinate dehydratase-1